MSDIKNNSSKIYIHPPSFFNKPTAKSVDGAKFNDFYNGFNKTQNNKKNEKKPSAIFINFKSNNSPVKPDVNEKYC